MKNATLTSALALGLVLGLAFGFCGSGLAQSFPTRDGNLDDAMLYALSESPEESAAWERSYVVAPTNGTEAIERAATLPAVPDFKQSKAAPTTELARAIQLATAHRLRGETVEAERYYAEIVRHSSDAKHVYFYAEVAQANGHHLLAGALKARYAQLSRGKVAPLTKVEGPSVRLAGLITHAREGFGLAGVTVHILDATRLIEYVALTDENGLFVVDGVSAAAPLVVECSRAGFEVSSETVAIDRTAVDLVPIVATRIYLQPAEGTVIN